jgi:hypothetical protein
MGTVVVRGFSTSWASKSTDALVSDFLIKGTILPEHVASPGPKMVQRKKQPTFTLGASYSSREQGHSARDEDALDLGDGKEGCQVQSWMFLWGRRFRQDVAAPCPGY